MRFISSLTLYGNPTTRRNADRAAPCLHVVTTRTSNRTARKHNLKKGSRTMQQKLTPGFITALSTLVFAMGENPVGGAYLVTLAALLVFHQNHQRK